MHPLQIGVLSAAALATLGLIWYVQFYLPEKLERRFLESMKAFSRAVELRFPSLAGHTEEVVALSVRVGRQMGLSSKDLKELEMAARLKDVGLCAISYEQMNERSPDDWSEAEWGTYRRHAEVSGAMLELVPSLRHLANMVRYHHASFNGADGGLAGTEIPLQSRIMKVASEYNWQRLREGDARALQQLQEGSGEAYCPDVVRVFQAVLTSSRVERREPSLVG